MSWCCGLNCELSCLSCPSFFFLLLVFLSHFPVETSLIYHLARFSLRLLDLSDA